MMRDETLERFQSGNFTNDYRLRALFLMIPHGETLLDLGSGNGVIADMLRGRFKRFVLSDYSEALTTSLRERFKGRDDVFVVTGDARTIALGEKFDVIVMCDLIEHVDDDMLVLAHARSLLKPGGRIFLSVPALPWLYGIRDATYGHRRRYTKKSLRKLLAQTGLRAASIRYWNCIGVLPYIVSEKMLKKPLIAPARSGGSSIFGRALNSLLYGVLRLESFIPLPLGLSLVGIFINDES